MSAFCFGLTLHANTTFEFSHACKNRFLRSSCESIGSGFGCVQARLREQQAQLDQDRATLAARQLAPSPPGLAISDLSAMSKIILEAQKPAMDLVEKALISSPPSNPTPTSAAENTSALQVREAAEQEFLAIMSKPAYSEQGWKEFRFVDFLGQREDELVGMLTSFIYPHQCALRRLWTAQ